MNAERKLFLIIFLSILLFVSSYEKPFGVKLSVPKNVVTSSIVTLECEFNAENIYSVSWYRGNFEFFRYDHSLAKEELKFFDFTISPGYTMKNYFDIKSSNMTHITLKNVTSALSGQYSCEVTTSKLTTVNASEKLFIYDSVDLQRPIIKVEKYHSDRFTSLNILCSIPSFKKIPIAFYVDNEEVNENFVIHDEGRSTFILNTSLLKWVPQNIKIISCRSILPGTSELNSDELHITLDSSNGNARHPRIDFLLIFVFVSSISVLYQRI